MILFKRLVFHLWYFRNPPWDTNVSPPELIAFLRSHQPGTALDLGCGTGTNAITLAEYGWQVVGVDFAWRAVEMARRKAKKANFPIDFRVGDVTHLPGLNRSFDLILDIGCYHSLDNSQTFRYRENLARLLAKGGAFLVYGFLRSDIFPTGLDKADFDAFSDQMRLVSRQDGRDGQRVSTWLHYEAE